VHPRFVPPRPLFKPLLCKLGLHRGTGWYVYNCFMSYRQDCRRCGAYRTASCFGLAYGFSTRWHQNPDLLPR
jgi:hypothetical protein